MSMKRFLGFIIMILMVINIMMFLPSASSNDNEMEWHEYYNLKGSCGSDNIRNHFQVNRTVVEIIINLTWTTEGGVANLDMWVEHAEGYVVNASDSERMPEVMMIRKFPNRGRWTLVVVPISCGSTGMVNFSANVTLRNIVLPKLVFPNEIDVGKNVTMSINSSHENVFQYFFDYGDGKDSGWMDEPSVSKTYSSEGKYYPRAKVRYSDGTESDWVEAGSLEVMGEHEDQNLLLIALASLIILVIITVIVLIIFKKRKGALESK
jgi:hypothetical protein